MFVLMVINRELIREHSKIVLLYAVLTFSYKISQSFTIFFLGIIIVLLFALYFYGKYALTKEKLEETKKILKERKLKV